MHRTVVFSCCAFGILLSSLTCWWVSLLCWRSLPPQQDFVTDSSTLLSDPMWVYSFQYIIPCKI
jgi:hypothetical protein